jgi:Caspase domain
MQIRDLKSVFESRYHFSVSEQSLNPITERKKSAQKLLQKCLADFVDEEDEKDSLLIVYYAGHGNPGTSGELILSGYVPL